MAKEKQNNFIWWEMKTVKAAILILLCTTNIFAQGYWSKQFAQVGTNNNVPEALAVDSKGNVYIGGGFDYAFGVNTKYFAKWNPETGWDSIPGQFGGSSFPIQSMAVGPNDEIFVFGGFSTIGSLRTKNVVKWNGIMWDSVPGSYQLGNFLYNVKLLSNGSKLYAVGEFTGGIREYVNGNWNIISTGIVEKNSNSSVHNRAITVDENGNLYVATYSNANWSQEVVSIVKWNGTSWSTVAQNISGSTGGTKCHVNDIAVYKDTVYVVGSFIQAGNKICNSIARWDGTKWDSLGAGTYSELYQVEVDDQGRVYVAGGNAPYFGNSNWGKISRWNGKSWEKLGAGIMNAQYNNQTGIKGMIIKNNKLYICGDFKNPGTVASTGVALYDIEKEKWIPLSGKNTNGFANGAVFAFHETKKKEIYIGGTFTFAGAAPVKVVAQWKHGRWDSIGTSNVTNGGTVSAITSDDSVVYFSGGISSLGGVASPGIIKWNGSNFISMTGPGQPSGKINAMAWYKNKLIVAGNFTASFGSFPNNKTVYSILQWDGTKWDSLNIGLTSHTYISTFDIINAGNVTALASNGTDLFVAGTFNHAGNDSVINIARWDGAQWHKVGDGILRFNKNSASASITAMSFVGNDLYVAGKFDSIGTKAYWHLAKWNGANWDTVSLALKGQYDGISDMTFDLQNRMYIVGNFSINNNNSLKYVARWNGADWEKLGTYSSNFQQDMFLAESDSKGNIYMSGYFGYVDGYSSQNFAAWINDPGIIESVKKIETAGIPLQFSLEQNFPNPFNPTTTINFSISKNMVGLPVSLKVYNILGKEVATIVNETFSPGKYSVQFNASKLASGMYFYRLQSGNFATVKKMLFIK